MIFHFDHLFLIWFSNLTSTKLFMTPDFPTIAYDLDVMAGRPPVKKAPEFGKRLAAARRLQGLTQDQLAKTVGLSQKMIDYYERRAVNIKSDIVRKFVTALNLSIDDLMGTQPPKAKAGRKSKLLQQFERVSRLPKSDQDLVSRLLNRFLENGSNGH
jgi:transcriptional regulator with XRE-family HTH domain